MKPGDLPRNRLAKLYNEDTHLALSPKETLHQKNPVAAKFKAPKAGL